MSKQSPSVRTVDLDRITALARQAAESPRKRTHLLLHADHGDSVQRLLIVSQPGTYIRPHSHTEQWELLVLHTGRAELITFSENGELAARIPLSTASPIVEIPAGMPHGMLMLEPATAVMEVKPGPYRPNEFATWAPAEGTPEAGDLLHWLAKSRIGERWSARGSV